MSNDINIVNFRNPILVANQISFSSFYHHKICIMWIFRGAESEPEVNILIRQIQKYESQTLMIFLAPQEYFEGIIIRNHVCIKVLTIVIHFHGISFLTDCSFVRVGKENLTKADQILGMLSDFTFRIEEWHD